MVSDQEILNAYLVALARVNRGEQSVQTAGAECLAYLLAQSRRGDQIGQVPAYDGHPGACLHRPLHQDDGA